MEPIFLHDWSESGLEGMCKDFEILPNQLAGSNILLASYTYEYYSGSAFVLFQTDGKLFEVNGSHCSCYGLEDQWEPEETSIEALCHRVTVGKFGRNLDKDEFGNDLLGVLNKLKEAIQ